MSAQCGSRPAGQTFQSAAGLVKLTGVCENFSDSSVEEEAPRPQQGEDPPTPEKTGDDSPTWATTSWKSDSGFNSDIGCGTNGLEQDTNDLPEWPRIMNDLDSPVSDDRERGNLVLANERIGSESMEGVTLQVPVDCLPELANGDCSDSRLRTPPPMVPVINAFHCEAAAETHDQTRSPEIMGSACVSRSLPNGTIGDPHTSDRSEPLNRADNQSESLDRISDRLGNPHPADVMGNHGRTNPFNRIPVIDDNHFQVARVIRVAAVKETKTEPAPAPVTHESSSHLRPSPSESKGSQGSTAPDEDELMDDEFELWEQNVLEMITESLNVEEDYFSQPEGFFGYSRYEELEQAIQKYKQRVMSTPEDSEKRQGLVNKLIQLRLKLQELKDEPENEDDDDKRKKVLGHQFIVCSGLKTQPSKCDVCATSMWNRLKAGYLCKECGFACHSKCIDIVKRHCVAAKLQKKSQYELAICPEVGLAAQNYRCADCKANISFKNDSNEPRQCDYSGLYYCQICHWNDMDIIPARAVHNWDFIPRKICRQSKQLLDLMRNKVVVNLDTINPGLFNRVEALTNIKKLREDILVMKLYFVSCKYAKEARLLRLLEDRPHFVEGSLSYTVQDLIETHADTLYDAVKEIHKIYSQHIRIECDLCRAKGFICELCRSDDLVFPFDIIATSCSKCSAVFHRDCFFKRKGVCPRCERQDRQDSASPDDQG